MYNKLFTKILDSSIWLETDATRIVWMTLIAAMDETGFVQFASVANLAHRARVTEEGANEAVMRLESPDKNSSDPDHEGRRIERVPGGWIILNAEKYRDLVTRAIAQEKTRQRVAKFRAKQHAVTNGNADVTPANVVVTPSEAVSETKAEAEPNLAPAKPPRARNVLMDALASVENIPLLEISSKAGARLATALATIRETSPAVTPEEIRKRGENLKLHFSTSPTAMSLASHWGKCHEPPPPRRNSFQTPAVTDAEHAEGFWGKETQA